MLQLISTDSADDRVGKIETIIIVPMSVNDLILGVITDRLATVVADYFQNLFLTVVLTGYIVFAK